MECGLLVLVRGHAVVQTWKSLHVVDFQEDVPPRGTNVILLVRGHLGCGILVVFISRKNLETILIRIGVGTVVGGWVIPILLGTSPSNGAAVVRQPPSIGGAARWKMVLGNGRLRGVGLVAPVVSEVGIYGGGSRHSFENL